MYKPFSIGAGLMLVLSGCSSATTSSPEPPEETSTSMEVEESPSPAAEPSDEPSPSPSTPEPTTYADVVVGSATTADICDNYSAILDQYDEIVGKRTKSLKGKDKDPYKAAKFANKNGWIYEDLAVAFDRDMTESATDALNAVSDGQAGVVESLEPYLEDSLQSCGLNQQHSTLTGDISTIDRQQAAIVTSAGNKPWYPKSYNEYTSNVAWKWAEGPDPCGYSRCWYNYIKVISRDGCPSGLYAEVNKLNSAGTVIGWSNDSVPSLGAGQKARLVFVSYDPSDSSSLAEISCY